MIMRHEIRDNGEGWAAARHGGAAQAQARRGAVRRLRARRGGEAADERGEGEGVRGGAAGPLRERGDDFAGHRLAHLGGGETHQNEPQASGQMQCCGEAAEGADGVQRKGAEWGERGRQRTSERTPRRMNPSPTRPHASVVIATAFASPMRFSRPLTRRVSLRH